MGKAVVRGILGLLVGVVVYPLVSVFLFHMPVENSTAGCIGLATGLVFFTATLWYDSSKKKKNSNEKKQ